ncbi:DUF1039 domain-containing protein [Citrobacter freundii]|nr:DUF1039 domain-containing protein [Citrobacter freundii]
MIDSRIKTLLIEALFMGLQHGLLQDAVEIMSALPLLIDDPDDITLCRVLFLLLSHDKEGARQLVGQLPEDTRQKVAVLFSK